MLNGVFTVGFAAVERLLQASKAPVIIRQRSLHVLQWFMAVERLSWAIQEYIVAVAQVITGSVKETFLFWKVS